MSKSEFKYVNNQLFCEDVNLSKIEACLTPCYVYSRAQLISNIKGYQDAFSSISSMIGFSMKANYTPEILKIIRDHGLNVITVSGCEIKLALKCGFKGKQIFFNGNGKQSWEIELAIENNCFLNVDSKFDSVNICAVAEKQDSVVQVLLRLNPSFSADVHPFLSTGKSSKFGIPESDLLDVLKTIKANSKVVIIGVHIHVGSTIRDVSVFTAVHQYCKKIIARHYDSFKHVKIINIGGGLAVDYFHQDGTDTPSPSDLANSLPGEAEYQILVEPGRSLVASTGVLLCRVLGTKISGDKRFAVIDGSMTELVRPALYQAYHHVLPCTRSVTELLQYDLVGPVCESSDCLATHVKLPPLDTGDTSLSLSLSLSSDL